MLTRGSEPIVTYAPVDNPSRMQNAYVAALQVMSAITGIALVFSTAIGAR
jgi:hypothetical protein